MVWFIMPIVLGEGTTPISDPKGVPDLGDACFRAGLSRSCCSTILAARSVIKRKRSRLDRNSGSGVYAISCGFTFIVCFLEGFEVPPFGSHQTTQFTERKVRVSSFDDCPHLTAE